MTIFHPLCFIGAASSYAITDSVTGTSPSVASSYDVRVIVDISGSMKKNDPINLRIPAINLLVKLLPEESLAGIWTFAQKTNNLVPLRKVTPAWRNLAEVEAKKINSLGQFTHIGLALEQVFNDFDQDKKGHSVLHHCILLSDGMVDIALDPALNVQEKNRILREVLPKFKKRNIHIHAIGLSQEADRAFLSQLSFETQGVFVLANNADELMKAFLKAFDSAIPQQQLPIENDQFIVSDDIKEFTALILLDKAKEQKETVLYSPDGQLLNQASSKPNVKWHHSVEYDLITVEKPAVGRWGVSAQMRPDSRITIVSDLNLAMTGVIPHLFAGQAQQFSLSVLNKNEAIKDKDFLSLIDVSLKQLHPVSQKTWNVDVSSSSKHEIRLPEQGAWKVKLKGTLIPGDHEITLNAESKTFSRKVMQRFTVHDELLSVQQKTHEVAGRVENYFEAILKSNLVATSGFKITGMVKNEKGIELPAAVESIAAGTWKIKAPEDIALGSYTLMLNIGAESLSGEPLTLSQGPYQVTAATPITPPVEKEASVEPVREPAKPATKEVPPVAEPEKAATSWWIWGSIIGAINLFLFIAGWLVYKKLIKKDEDEGLADEEKIKNILDESERVAAEISDNDQSEDSNHLDLELDDDLNNTSEADDKIEDFGISKDFGEGDK